MPVLKNPKHELFAHSMAKGATAGQAYIDAGYTPDAKNAARLTKNDEIRVRINELMTPAIQATEISVERIMQEYEAIATADITDILEWGEALAVKNAKGEIVIANGIMLKPSADLPKRVSAAISEIRQTREGTLTVKMHSKLGALDSLAKIKDLLVEKKEERLHLTLEQLVTYSYEEQERRLALPAPEPSE